MSSIKQLNKIQANQLIMECVKKKTHVTITRKYQDSWQLFKSQFQSYNAQNIILSDLRIVYGETENPHGEIAISLRKGNSKLIFKTFCAGKTLTWPNSIIKVSRGIYQRKQPNESKTVRFWDTNQPRESRDVHYAELVNISGGGFAASCPRTYNGKRYTCAVDIEPNIVVDALLKHCNLYNGRYLLQFQFLGVDLNPLNILKKIQMAQIRFQYPSFNRNASRLCL